MCGGTAEMETETADEVHYILPLLEGKRSEE
jgi:hypothetical protein